MVCLMALSNTYGWMMVNTGNKSEAAMGFSTLYGDTSGAFAPIGGLYKTDVFALSRWVNERAAAEGKVPPIPEHIITKPPSAELSPGAEDEKALGIDYATLDQILTLTSSRASLPKRSLQQASILKKWPTRSVARTPTRSSAPSNPLSQRQSSTISIKTYA